MSQRKIVSTKTEKVYVKRLAEKTVTHYDDGAISVKLKILTPEINEEELPLINVPIGQEPV